MGKLGFISSWVIKPLLKMSDDLNLHVATMRRNDFQYRDINYEEAYEMKNGRVECYRRVDDKVVSPFKDSLNPTLEEKVEATYKTYMKGGWFQNFLEAPRRSAIKSIIKDLDRQSKGLELVNAVGIVVCPTIGKEAAKPVLSEHDQALQDLKEYVDFAIKNLQPKTYDEFARPFSEDQPEAVIRSTFKCLTDEQICTYVTGRLKGAAGITNQPVRANSI